MRFIVARLARPSRRRRREVSSAQFDGGQSAAASCRSIRLGCDVLEQRIVLFSQGTITGYRGHGGTVEIPARVHGVPVAVIGAGAFQGNATITRLVIPGSVIQVDDKAFGGCPAWRVQRSAAASPLSATARSATTPR